jgi:uncharacterized protein (DUF305 family)
MKNMLAAAVLILAGLGTTGCQHAGMHATAEAQDRYGKSYERYAGEMSSGMAKMMSDMHAPGYSGDPDIDFLAMMIPHHAGAVDMARLVLQHGTDPVTRKLAEDIIASQQVEIAGMQRRLHDLRYGASRTDPGGYPALGGTRGGQEHGNKQ